jgi:uncharacterized protein YfaS (alpha-2-macroglobulin family)
VSPLFRFLGRRGVMITCAAIVIVAIGAGLGLYLATRHQLHATASRNVGPAPSVAPVGTTAVATPRQAPLLTVVSAVPAPGSAQNPVDTAVTLNFNLPVDPAAVSSFLSVTATGQATPTVTGTVSQGIAPEQVVFKAPARFDVNATVQVILRAGLQSIDGSALAGDYSFSFATVPGPRTVTFLKDQEQARFINAASGSTVDLTMQAGPGLSGSVALSTYRPSVQNLLSAFVYANGGYPDRPVDTSSMTRVDSGTTMTASGARVSTVQDGEAANVTEPDGLYVVVAQDGAGQYGAVWINFSRYAILLRQDDQRVVVAGEDMTTGDATSQFSITFYNLLNGVHAKASGSFSGAAEFAAKYPSGFDFAVAETEGETVIVPMGAPETNGDIRIVGDLSQQLKIFVTTDRLAYRKGDTVRFGGAVRVSNDQTYALGSGLKLDIWAPAIGSTVATAAVAADGTFSGSFVIPAAVFNGDGADAAVAFLAVAHGTVPSNLILQGGSVTVVALATHSPTTSVTVALDRQSYVASDRIVASVTGPASATVNVTIYGSQHVVQPSEIDSFVGTSSWGDVVQQPIPLKLDTSGHGTYGFAANLAKRAVDMDLTLAATYGSGAAQAVGARTATVYQATAEVFLLPARLEYREGDPVMVPFVVEARDGSRVSNASMSYQLESTDYSGSTAVTTVVASGTVNADANGLGVVRTSMNTHISPVTLVVKGKDTAGNVFQDTAGLGIDAVRFGAFSSDTNARLDMLSDKIAYAAGDSAQLTIGSPTAESALLSLERGRIHLYRTVQLAKGDNPITVPVTPDLAPGFDVVISYFHAGEYTTQAFPIHVKNSGRLLTVKLTPDRTSYAKGDTAHVTVSVTDATGAPVVANALGDAYDLRMSAFKTVDKDSIAGAFLTAGPLLTNGSSSLLGIGIWGGMCGGGYYVPAPDAIYAGQAVVWSPDVAIGASGQATIDVPISGPVRLAVFAGTKDSAWGQAEIDLGAQ